MSVDDQPLDRPRFSDRSTGLAIFGWLQIVMGGFTALMIPLMLLSLMVSHGAGSNVNMMLPVVVFYEARAGAGLDVRVWAATTDLVLELLLHRAGIGVLPADLAEPWIRRRRLVRFDPRVAPLTDAIWLNEVRERYRGSALVAFREAVIASFS